MQTEASKTRIQPSIAIASTYTLIATIYCFSFSILFYVVVQHTFLAIVHLLACASVVTNYYILQKTKNFERATRIILTTGTCVVVSLFATGGWERTGFLWPFAYLPFAFFLTRGRSAQTWVLILFAACLAVVVLQVAGLIYAPYSTIEVFNYFAALLIFALCSLLYQRATVNYEDFLFYTRNLMEVSPDPFITIDQDYRISDVNQVFQKLAGLPREKIVGRDFANFFTEPARA